MNKLNQIFSNKRHNSHKPAAGSAFTISVVNVNNQRIYLKSTHEGIHYTLREVNNKLKLILSIYSDGSSLLPEYAILLLVIQFPTLLLYNTECIKSQLL